MDYDQSVNQNTQLKGQYLTRTFVIFSMFLTDFKRMSISRRVAILRAFVGAAPSGEGWAATRARLRRASIADSDEEVRKWQKRRDSVSQWLMPEATWTNSRISKDLLLSQIPQRQDHLHHRPPPSGILLSLITYIV